MIKFYKVIYWTFLYQLKSESGSATLVVCSLTLAMVLLVLSLPCKACAASDASTTGMQIHIRLLASAPFGLSSSLYQEWLCTPGNCNVLPGTHLHIECWE